MSKTVFWSLFAGVNMAEEEEENIFSFRDKTPVPDPIHEYTDSLKDAHTSIIIDNGKDPRIV